MFAINFVTTWHISRQDGGWSRTLGMVTADAWKQLIRAQNKQRCCKVCAKCIAGTVVQNINLNLVRILFQMQNRDGSLFRGTR